MKRLLFIILWSACLFAEEIKYEFEGVFYDPAAKYTFSTFSLFLPYNPTILSFEPANLDLCHRLWPKGTVFLFSDASLREVSGPIDFLWLDQEPSDLIFISDLLNWTGIVYTPTLDASYPNLKAFFAFSGYDLLAHWHLNGKGNAAFVRRDIFDGVMRSLNYSPSGLSQAISYPREIDRFFRKVEKDASPHAFDEVDYIYMINLDERPEKFQMAKFELELYGIHPYRFSAVNGWKLPNFVINQLGVEFTSIAEKTFRGTIFKEVDGREYISNEWIEPKGQTYFTIGMSRGAIGINLSHLSVLQDAYDSGYKTIWVMEDDVQVVGDPAKIPLMIQNLDSLAGDWDILFTDLDTKDTKGNPVPCRALAARPNFAMEPLSVFFQKFYSINTDLSRVGMRYGAYSMILRRSGIEKILKHFKTYNIFLPYDMDYWLIPDLKMYTVNRDIITHRNGAPTDNGSPNYLKKD